MSLRKVPAPRLRKIAANAICPAALSAACLLMMPRADADIHYTQSLTLPSTAGGSLPASFATYAKGQRERQETTVRSGSFKTTMVVLTLGDTGQIVRMDPALKIYTTTAISASPVAPFGLPSPPRPGLASLMADPGMPDDASSPFGFGNAAGGGSPFPMPGASAPASPAPFAAGGDGTVSASPMITGDPPAGAGAEPTLPQAPAPTGAAQTTGKVVLTYTTQDMGAETVHDLTTHRYSVTVRRQASGCAGTGDTTTKMQVWFAPVKTGLAFPERSAPQRTITTARGCKITYVTQGDVDALTELADELPVRITFFGKDGKEQGTMEMQTYDQASLDDSLFALPSDYKQVTASEFASAENQAVTQGMTGGVSPFAPAQGNQSGAYPAPTTPGGPDAVGGAFPAPTGGGDAGTVNPSGAYPAPTQPAPAGAP